MGFVEDLSNKVRDYLSGDYDVMESRGIPTVDNVSHGKKAKKMNLCAFSIDLRKSSDLLFHHHKQTAGKIHKAFLAVASSVVLKYGGKIRSFQGDSILVFWPAYYKSQIMDAVRAAMEIKWFLSSELSSLFESYSKLDYGIGIDWGEVFIVRAGISRDTNNNDLVFIGKCVNFAVVIANQAEAPYNIEISLDVYENLDDSHRYTVKNNNEVNLWNDGIVEWNNERYRTKTTDYYWGL
ncbi:MAG: adenylate/guanylate cyclase domain-containing protein [Candidatus Thorarchaeota archaeon]